MQLKLIAQIGTFFASQTIVPLVTIFGKIPWITNNVGFPLLFFSIIMKVSRMGDKNQLKKNILSTQYTFLVPYGLMVLLCYFFYQQSAFIQASLADIILGILRICLQFAMFSFVSSPQTILKEQYVVYMIILYFWIFSNGVITVLTIKIGDQGLLIEQFKDLSILFCTTIIGSGVLMMDMISRALDEKNKRKQEVGKKEIEMLMI